MILKTKRRERFTNLRGSFVKHNESLRKRGAKSGNSKVDFGDEVCTRRETKMIGFWIWNQNMILRWCFCVGFELEMSNNGGLWWKKWREEGDSVKCGRKGRPLLFLYTNPKFPLKPGFLSTSLSHKSPNPKTNLAHLILNTNSINTYFVT